MKKYTDRNFRNNFRTALMNSHHQSQEFTFVYSKDKGKKDASIGPAYRKADIT